MNLYWWSTKTGQRDLHEPTSAQGIHWTGMLANAAVKGSIELLKSESSPRVVRKVF